MDALDSARTLLLVMDYQPSVLGRYPDVETLLERAHVALDAARAAEARVGWVRVALTPDEAAAVPPSNRMFAGIGDRMAGADPALTELDPRAGARSDEPVFRKRRVGALSTTDLAEWTREHGVDTLVLAGVSTSGVVLSTVRDAADRDYRVVVLADACGDSDPQVHRVLTEKVFPRQAEVVDVAEFAAALS